MPSLRVFNVTSCGTACHGCHGCPGCRVQEEAVPGGPAGEGGHGCPRVYPGCTIACPRCALCVKWVCAGCTLGVAGCRKRRYQETSGGEGGYGYTLRVPYCWFPHVCDRVYLGCAVCRKRRYQEIQEEKAAGKGTCAGSRTRLSPSGQGPLSRTRHHRVVDTKYCTVQCGTVQYRKGTRPNPSGQGPLSRTRRCGVVNMKNTSVQYCAVCYSTV